MAQGRSHQQEEADGSAFDGSRDNVSWRGPGQFSLGVRA